MYIYIDIIYLYIIIYVIGSCVVADAVLSRLVSLLCSRLRGHLEVFLVENKWCGDKGASTWVDRAMHVIQEVRTTQEAVTIITTSH